MYTAAILTPNSSGLLRYAAMAAHLEVEGFGFKPDYPHHMTINLGCIDEDLNVAEVVGQTARLHVKRFGWCDRLGVCAAEVFKAEVEMKEFPVKFWQELSSFNEHPHITMCVRSGVPPRLSNDMLKNGPYEWIELDQTYMLDAVVEEVNQ